MLTALISSLIVSQAQPVVPEVNTTSRELNFLTSSYLSSIHHNIEDIKKNNSSLSPSVYVKSLENSSYVSYEGNRSVKAASTIKFPLLVMALHEIEKGNLKKEDILSNEERLRASDSKSLPSEITLIEALELMSINSNNTATNLVIEKLGGAKKINKYLDSINLKTTRVANWLPDLPGHNRTSAREMSYLFEQLDSGDILNEDSYELLLDIMSKTKNSSYLGSQIKRRHGVLYHKTGTLRNVVADVGLVKKPDGEKYVVSIFVEGPDFNQDDIPTFRKIAKLVRQHFSPEVKTATKQPKPITVGQYKQREIEPLFGNFSKAVLLSSVLSAEGTDVSNGPGNGFLSCAWAVNRFGLEKIFGTKIGANPNLVVSVRDQLEEGLAELVPQDEAQPGDIVITAGPGTKQHIGFVVPTKDGQGVEALSTRGAKFAWRSDLNFEMKYVVKGKIYRLKD